MEGQHDQEYFLQSPPNDGISAVKFSPNSDLLLVSSWDSGVRLYDARANFLRHQYYHKAAVLDCCFSDASHSFSGGLDRGIKMFDFNTSSEIPIGQHEKPVRCVKYDQASGCVVSGGWDGMVHLWDPRAGGSVGNATMPGKVFTMALTGTRVIVGTSGRHVLVYDLRNLAAPEQRRESSLKYQTRAIGAFNDGTGYALSSIEGRVAVEYLDQGAEAQAKKYAFKCHRVGDLAYPVNAIEFHPVYGTFATGGCDGVVNVWDGANKKRLCQFHKYPTSIAALAFSHDGSLMAIASSYTFESGDREHPADSITIRNVSEADVKPKARA